MQYRKHCSATSKKFIYKPTKSKNAEFERSRDYLVALSDKLSALEKISTRINKEQQDSTGELQAYFPVFHSWSQIEPELAPVLENISGAIEKVALAHNTLASCHQSKVADPIKELLGYIDVVRIALYRRQAYQNVYDSSAEELGKMRADKDQLVAARTSAQNRKYFLWPRGNDEMLEKFGKNKWLDPISFLYFYC